MFSTHLQVGLWQASWWRLNHKGQSYDCEWPLHPHVLSAQQEGFLGFGGHQGTCTMFLADVHSWRGCCSSTQPLPALSPPVSLWCCLPRLRTVICIEPLLVLPGASAQWSWIVFLWSRCHGVLHVQVTGLAKLLSLWNHKYF